MIKRLATIAICVALLVAGAESAWARQETGLSPDQEDAQFYEFSSYDPQADFQHIRDCLVAEDDECLLLQGTRLSIDPILHAVIGERMAEMGHREEARQIFLNARLALFNIDYREQGMSYADGMVDIATRQYFSGFESDAHQTLRQLHDELLSSALNWTEARYGSGRGDFLDVYTPDEQADIPGPDSLSEYLSEHSAWDLRDDEFGEGDDCVFFIISHGRPMQNWIGLLNTQMALGDRRGAQETLTSLRSIIVPLTSLLRHSIGNIMFSDSIADFAIRTSQLGQGQVAREFADRWFDLFMQAPAGCLQGQAESLAVNVGDILSNDRRLVIGNIQNESSARVRDNQAYVESHFEVDRPEGVLIDVDLGNIWWAIRFSEAEGDIELAQLLRDRLEVEMTNPIGPCFQRGMFFAWVRLEQGNREAAAAFVRRAAEFATDKIQLWQGTGAVRDCNGEDWQEVVGLLAMASELGIRGEFSALDEQLLRLIPTRQGWENDALNYSNHLASIGEGDLARQTMIRLINLTLDLESWQDFGGDHATYRFVSQLAVLGASLNVEMNDEVLGEEYGLQDWYDDDAWSSYKYPLSRLGSIPTF